MSKVIIVTGASRGIGASIAVDLARRGFVVGCLSRKGYPPARAGLEADVTGRLIAEACDVSSESSVRWAFDSVSRRAGGIHGLVNNAGIHLDGPSHEFPASDFDRVFATNVTGLFFGCREAYRHLVAVGGGLIVNIGSFFDKLGVKRNLAYCASKAAVAAITRCLAVEWARKGIRVLNVAPGYIATDLNREKLEGPLASYLENRIPAGKPGTVDTVSRFVADLYAEDNAFLTGETIYIDGGQGVAH